MLFNSPIFLFLFLPFFYFLYFISPKKIKNITILVASIVFYSWGEPTFVYIAILSAFLDWILAKFIYNSVKITTKRVFLVFSITLNLGLLCYFKYFNFFIENINIFLSSIHFKPLGYLEIALPLAISFIVFEKITYVVDVFKGKGKPAKSLVDYLTYVLVFPKLIAGPIIKYHDIEKQLQERVITKQDIDEGFYRFVKGLAKKVFIADTMAEVVDFIFKIAPSQLGFLDAWLGVICFTIQIYFDFSGYSDMAIGLLRIMGFKIMENFNLPYIARNFTDFWRRWHISLSTFIKEYLYIPLGGNRCSKFRQYVNLIICFFLSGLWHGAAWTYILWGCFHGMFLVFDKMFGIKPDTKRDIPVFLQILITFFLVVISWTIFRSENMNQLSVFIQTMVNPVKMLFNSAYMFTNNVIFMLILGLIVSFLPATKFYAKLNEKFSRLAFARYAMMLFILLLTIGKISGTSYTTFIYFRF